MIVSLLSLKKCPRKFTKNVHENSPKKCPQKFTPKEEFSWTKISTRIREKCLREFTHFVHENSPFMVQIYVFTALNAITFSFCMAAVSASFIFIICMHQAIHFYHSSYRISAIHQNVIRSSLKQ